MTEEARTESSIITERSDVYKYKVTEMNII